MLELKYAEIFLDSFKKYGKRKYSTNYPLSGIV